MKKNIFMITLITLSACVSSPDYGDALNNLVGSNQTTLENVWVSPSNVNYLTPDQVLWTYFQDSPSGEEFCRTTFTITDNVITDFSFEGDNCTLSAYSY